MRPIIDLVDSIDYVSTNCFQSQLFQSLKMMKNVITVPLKNIHEHPCPEFIICRLKQRTLYNHLDVVRLWAKNAPITIYDQDPWHAFMDDSPYKGSYDAFKQNLNIKMFCVTTKWWCDFMNERGYPSTFVKMWMLPSYCSDLPHYIDRPIDVGFVGQLHSHRASFMNDLIARGVKVHHINGLSYNEFLNALSLIKIFVHNENMPLTCSGKITNMGKGMWIKDIEACARGCYSIRNVDEGHETYLTNVTSALQYNDIDDAVALIKRIQMMDPDQRQHDLITSVRFIQRYPGWQKTTMTLMS